jgi:hypothetical protein
MRLLSFGKFSIFRNFSKRFAFFGKKTGVFFKKFRKISNFPKLKRRIPFNPQFSMGLFELGFLGV